MDSRRSIKRLLKGGKGPTYHQRVSHVRNKSSYGGSGAGGGLLGAGAGEGGEGGMGGLYGDEFTKETLLRIVQKEVIEAPSEQEMLFLCAVGKGKAAKGGYNLGGFVGGGAGGGGGGERSRYLCVALEQGSRPAFGASRAAPAAAGEEAASTETFVVMYYFTVAPGPTDYQVAIKTDVYLNDLTAVEFGTGADFALAFDQTSTPLQLSAPSQALRDEIVWNLLTICDLLCHVQPETRAVDLHGLSLTATTQGFLGRNEAMAKYMALALQQDKGKLGAGGSGGSGAGASSLLIDPFLSAHANDEEVEGMLDRFKWPARTVDDIDGQLSQQLRQLERETIEVLLSWETRAKQEDTKDTTTTSTPPSSSAPTTTKGKGKGKEMVAVAPPRAPVAAPTIDPTSRGYLSTLQLVGMLDDLEGELETMEAWLSGKGDALKFMQADMLEIEAENNRLERQWKNYSRLNALLKPLVAELALDPDSEKMLRNPARHLELPPSGLSESQSSEVVVERVDALVAAARRVQRALALLEGRDVGAGGGGIEEMVGALASGQGNKPQASSNNKAGPPTTVALPPPILISPAGMGAVGGAIKVVMQQPLPLPPSPVPGQQPPAAAAQAAPLKAIPRRLMGMESMRSQGGKLAAVRAEFVEKAGKYVAGLFPKFVRAEALPGAKEAGGLSSGGGNRNSLSSAAALLLTPQGLGQYQRAFHTRVLDYEPLVAVVVEMLQDLPSASAGASLLDDLLHAYSDTGNTTLYRPLLKAYFAQLHARYSSSSSSLTTATTTPSPDTPAILLPAAAAATGKADMASLPRAHISDMGSLTAPVLHPSPTRNNSSVVSPVSPTQMLQVNTATDLAGYYQQQAAAMGATPSLAIGQALTQLVPLVRREQAFVTELFRLRPEEVEDDRGKLQSVLEVEFDKLRERLTELAEAATDADPLEGLAILTVMQQTLAPLGSNSNHSSPVASPTGSSRSSLALGASVTNAGRAAGAAGGEDSFLAEMLASLQQSLSARFAKFVGEQEQWVVHQTPDIKRAGVLAPLAKFPVFVDRLALAVRGRPLEMANSALSKLSASLLGWLEKVAQRDPKYADVVRLENYHFFVQTMSPRQQRLMGSSALLPYIDQAQACHEAAVQRYVAWSLGYEFPELTTFFARLEDLIVKVGISDVAIHVPKAQLAKLMADACSRKALAEGLQNAYKRLRKHISDDSGLFLPLWDRIAALLVQRFARYEEVALGCYDVRLEPSANLVRQLAQECRAQGGK